MLLHAERPLGITLRILPCNSSIQACIKPVANYYAKKSYLAQENRVKFHGVCLYSMLHILTQLIQIFNNMFSDLLLCASRL